MSEVNAEPDVNAEPWNRTDWTPQSIKEWNTGVVEEFRANAGKVGGPYAGGDLLLLTTTGAVAAGATPCRWASWRTASA